MLRAAAPLTALVLPLILLVAAPACTTAQVLPRPAAADSTPLFSSHEPLAFTLVADFELLEADRSAVSPERPALLQLTGEDGTVDTIPLEVRTRGNFRLRRRTCAFPNLRLDFDRTSAALSTPFAKQDALKLVGHCRDRDSYEQNLMEEYLAYRLYNLVTETSFRVRLARITYRDVADRRAPVTRLAFLIENVEMLAERLGGVHVEAPGAAPDDLHGLASARAELFQYMIGNTDFSIVNFHNAEVVRLPDGHFHPVPYDFDFSGLVDAPYAAPAALLGTRSVRDRVFRGFCRPTVDMSALFSEFLALRGAVAETLRSQPELDPDNAERAIRYLEEFFDVIESPRARRNLIERRCRMGID